MCIETLLMIVFKFKNNLLLYIKNYVERNLLIYCRPDNQEMFIIRYSGKGNFNVLGICCESFCDKMACFKVLVNFILEFKEIIEKIEKPF
jgi:hypothetical protein